jgi:diguanylate cyclase (GGDEF)-like protein
MFFRFSNSEILKQAKRWLRLSPTPSLQGMLTIPFIIQVVAVVSLVGYLSYRNGEKSVEDLTNQLMTAVSNRVEQKLTSYLEPARLLNQINHDTARRGALNLALDPPDRQTELYLWQQMRLFKNLTWITLGTENGNALGIWRPGSNQNLQFSFSNRSTQYFGNYYAIDTQGRRTTRLKIERPAFDPRTRPWYKDAIAAKQGIWSPIYAGFTPGTIFIAASQPLYDPTGQLVGVSGIDISLLEIQNFLAQNSVSNSGQIFLMERSGLLVASSSAEKSFLSTPNPKRSPQRVNVLESKIPSIKFTAQSLLKQVKNFKNIQKPQKFSFYSNRKTEFVKVLPFSMGQGIDWLIVIVVPESDVMAQIHKGTQITALSCLAALIGVIGLNVAISRWIAKPIINLNRASQKIAQGDFEHQIQNPNILELSALAESFTQMSRELQESRQQLEDYSKSLEQKVSDRTQSLEQEIQRRATAETALQSANQELQNLAYLDGLTQIANRRQLDQQLLQEWQRLKRDQQPLSFILCDVDYFKQYNDTYGHQAGDECLQHIAQAIAAAARRPPDLAARYGGEEFAMLLPNTSPEGAMAVAQKIQAQIKFLQLPHSTSEVGPYVTASFGVTSIIPTESQNPEFILAQADHALYQAKKKGRDRIVRV